jgi:uncharacterized membrane protein
MRGLTVEGRNASLITAGSIALAALLIGVISILPSITTYDTWGAVFIGPVLVLISLPALSRQARREGDRRLFWLLLVALVLKLLGGILRDFVANEAYGGSTDATGYHGDGVRISANFQSGIFETDLDSLTKTDFISFFTGLVYTFIGASRLGGYLFYSWLGFWGLYFFYRAFTIAVPEGKRRMYAYLLFFMPSLLFWPSGIGKEAWMVFALGIASFGAARLLTGRTWQGFAITIIGLWLAGIVRLHIAGMLAVALAAGYLLRKPAGAIRRRGVVAKGLSLAAVAAVTIFLVLQAEQSLKESGIQTQAGITGALQDVAERTATGDSQFQPSVIRSPVRAPEAAFTVLFRPLPFEAHNAQALATAAETSLLLLLTVLRWRWVLAAVRSFRRQAYVGFALAYTAVFILAYSSIANLGILARQRVQLLPLFLVILCIPPRRKREVDASSVVAETATAPDRWDVPTNGDRAPNLAR